MTTEQFEKDVLATLNTISARVKFARKLPDIQLTQRGLAVKIGVSPQTIQQIEDPKGTKKSRYLPEIAQICRVNSDWMIFNRGLPRSDGMQMKAPGGELCPHEHVRCSPTLAPTLSLSEARECEALYTDWLAGKEHRECFSVNHHTDEEHVMFGVVIDDDSLIGETIQAGDILLVDTQRKPRPGNLVLACRNSNSAPVVRRMRLGEEEADGTCPTILVPANEDYPTVRVQEVDGGTILGVVVEHSRSLT